MSDEKDPRPLNDDPPAEAGEPKQVRRQPYRPPTLEPLGSVWESTEGTGGGIPSDALFVTTG